MKVILYCTYDKVGKFFNPVQCEKSETVDNFLINMRRSLYRIKDPVQIAYLRDQIIYHLGYYDDETGVIDLLPEKVELIKLGDWLSEIVGEGVDA